MLLDRHAHSGPVPFCQINLICMKGSVDGGDGIARQDGDGEGGRVWTWWRSGDVREMEAKKEALAVKWSVAAGETLVGTGYAPA